ncbi:MAG: iron ABC transporter permease [candidate division WOR-3 bacterium]|nr:iron ABC transporter permease [candidate division WOR-3 bacterium]MCX7947097.1 iron ABC transporter permease [candidate division WOR-3 bacterium]MDW8149862.1 iron ABC transporter permease [candidate division WOR-3 bacterium]
MIFLILSILSIVVYILGSDISLIELTIHKLMLIFIVGSSLSIAGLILQVILKNPLVEPYILGISSCAGIGFVISIVFNLNIFFTNVIMLSLVILCFLVIISNYGSNLKFILIGISINLICSSLINLIMAISKQDIFKTIFILWGNLDRVLTKQDAIFLYFCFVVVLVSILYTIIQRKKLLILSLSDEEALSLGLNIKKYKKIFLSIAFILTSISVYFSGIIGFLGLIVPHISRIIHKDNYFWILVSSINLSIFLLIVSVIFLKFSKLSIPVGIITSLIGVPFFIFILLKYLK